MAGSSPRTEDLAQFDIALAARFAARKAGAILALSADR
jgi:hypothetical protein